MNKGDFSRSRRYEQLFHFIRRTYHRLPVPNKIKWRLREKLWPFVETLREGRGDLLTAISSIHRQSENPVGQDPHREHSLRKIVCYLGNKCKDSGPIGHVVALPFLGTGGAEMTALNFSAVVHGIRPEESILIVLTDRPLVSENVLLPSGIILLVLDEFIEGNSTYDYKKKLLFDLLVAIKPHNFHNINSEIGWQVILSQGERLRGFLKIYASIFAFQFDSDGKTRIGYAANFFQGGFPFLTALLSDNQRFIQDLISVYGVSEGRDRLVAVYNPCRVSGGEWSEQAKKRILGRSSRGRTRPKILWAGRLDAEKRFDLFTEVVKLAPFADFEVFGQKVVDGRASMVVLPNLFFRGPFSHPQDLVAQCDYDAFIFTSKWEGMPNILLEVGALGIPIVASQVGGVGELIHEDTGYPISANAPAEVYADALQKLLSDYHEAGRRALNLVDLIERRHSWSSFCNAVSSLPGYVEPFRAGD